MKITNHTFLFRIAADFRDLAAYTRWPECVPAATEAVVDVPLLHPPTSRQL